MPVVIGCLLMLVVGAFVAMQFGILSGSSQQVRNAVDAGALNIAVRATDVPVAPPGEFGDVANSSGGITLANVNRVYGKAMLINLNAESMIKSGQAGQAQGSAQQAVAEADQVSQQLKKAITDQDFLTRSFSQVDFGGSSNPAGSNGSGSARHLKNKSAPSFTIGYVHGGQTSNISADPSQTPPGLSLHLGGPLVGYTVVKANGHSFYFLPFKHGEKPHLISTDEFNGHKSPPSDWSSPVPNALQASGQLGPDLAMQSTASAVVNPQLNYRLAIPHAFVEIKVQKTPVTWLVNGKKVAESMYQFQPDTQYKVANYKVGCKSQLNGYANVGNEYKGGTLLAAFNGVPGTQAHKLALQNLAQRISEIQAGYTVKQVSQLLAQQQLVPDVYTYVIYPVYKNADNSDPQVKIAPIGNVQAGWFNSGATADGTAKSLGSESLEDSPNSNWGQVVGAWQLQAHHVNVNGQVMWTPGTGYNQCLGLLELSRSARVTFDGKCP